MFCKGWRATGFIEDYPREGGRWRVDDGRVGNLSTASYLQTRCLSHSFASFASLASLRALRLCAVYCFSQRRKARKAIWLRIESLPKCRLIELQQRVKQHIRAVSDVFRSRELFW